MELFLAGTVSGERRMAPFLTDAAEETIRKTNILLSMHDWPFSAANKLLMKLCRNFMLDSGAFTYQREGMDMRQAEEFVEQYARFVKEHQIARYLEFDIDNVIGEENVATLRRRLEDIVGWPCIPVWHASRGYKRFIEYCEEYPYVAIGGIAARGRDSSAVKSAIPRLADEAHKRGAKLHGLGYTPKDGLKLAATRLDSADSSAWTASFRYGFAYKFNGHGVNVIERDENTKTDTDKMAFHGFCEWAKYCEWARESL